MAIKHLGRGVTLAFNDGTAKSFAKIQSYTFSQGQELAEFLSGNSRVNSHWAGVKTGTIQIETGDLSVLAALTVGTYCTAVVLTIEGALDSGGTAVGGDVTVTFDKAVISEIGDINHGNENSSPVVQSITFTLTHEAATGTDGTIAVAEDV